MPQLILLYPKPRPKFVWPESLEFSLCPPALLSIPRLSSCSVRKVGISASCFGNGDWRKYTCASAFDAKKTAQIDIKFKFKQREYTKIYCKTDYEILEKEYKAFEDVILDNNSVERQSSIV